MVAPQKLVLATPTSAEVTPESAGPSRLQETPDVPSRGQEGTGEAPTGASLAPVMLLTQMLLATPVTPEVKFTSKYINNTYC